jgi:uncharacterized protein (TIGR03083 family)
LAAAVDDETAWALLATERRAFADALDPLTPEQWATPSLCEGWTVRDVVAHTMVGPTTSTVAAVKAMALSGFRFDRANQRMAADRAGLPTDELVATLREKAESRFVPPGGTVVMPLTDLFVHRLDCLVPLGLPTGRPLDPWPVMLDFLVSRKARLAFVGRGLPSLTYVATDVDWSGGSGPRVEGPAEALGLAIMRRGVRLDELAGPGSGALAAWARR